MLSILQIRQLIYELVNVLNKSYDYFVGLSPMKKV